MFSAFKSVVRSACSKFTKRSRSVLNVPIAILVSVSEESLVDGLDSRGLQASTETATTFDLDGPVQVPEVSSSATDSDDENDEYETYIFNPAPPATITSACNSDCDISIASDYGTIIRHRPYDAPWNDRVTCPREADCECCSFGDIESEYGGEWYNYSEWELAMEHDASIECDDELMRMFECHDCENDNEDVFECETYEDGETVVKDVHATCGVSIQFNWSDYQGCAAVVECEDGLASAFEYKSECESDAEENCFECETLECAEMELVKDVDVTSGVSSRFNWSGYQECVAVVEYGDESMSMFRYESECGSESESEDDWFVSKTEVKLMSHDECSAMFKVCFEDSPSAVPEIGSQCTWLDHVEHEAVQYELGYESGSEIDEEDERLECERKADSELAVTVQKGWIW
ncbi:hypothetical protein BDQ12DRAFT_132127 [Crucibulum laeve]|uniref:Uncharacterized protein n=1 Tax=Crucibulum laeve TaxID=68775 RepID=A0A5C3LZW0_9AGAR|nr:hypothetical protein BDQ12DRAFT_132127 [Crucibulum laeve]